MGDYQHLQKRFDFLGICLSRAIDNLPQFKAAILRNLRQYQAGVLQPRKGQTAAYSDTLVQTNVHSIKRLNNDIPGATQAYSIIVGAGTQLFSDNNLHTTLNNSRASGFSGDPLSIIPFRPNKSPEPYAYIADRTKMGKLNVAGTFRNIGIAPPTTYPKGPSNAATPSLNSFQFTTIDSGINTAGSWAAGTGVFGVTNAAGPTDTISGIVYDTGTTGWACVAISAPTDTRFYQVGYMVTTNTASETVIFDSIYTPIKTTTIQSIAYDSGTTGLCTIVLSSMKRKALVPNAMMLINSGGGSAEYVRIISVTFGDDDLPSLRCSTVNNHTAGESITGVLSFRAFFANNHAAAETFTFRNINISCDALAAGATVVGFATKAGALDLSDVGGRPIQDTDEINFIINLTDTLAASGLPPTFQEVQIQLDIDNSNFNRNYYYITLRPSTLSPVIAGQQTVQDAKKNKISDDIVSDTPLATDNSDAQLRERLQRKIAKAVRNGNLNRAERLRRRLIDLDVQDVPPVVNPNPPGSEVPAEGVSSIPALGLNTYIPIRIKVKDLQRIGSDLSKTLANVAAIRIRFIAKNNDTVATVAGDFSIAFGSFWIGGSYGPDAGTAGTPYLYRYRYRASESGARSFPSPATRSGVIPRRQRVQLVAAASSDAQVDKIDWFRFGGSLNVWKYIGTGPNSTATFNDDFPDDVIFNREELTFNDFQPFPILGSPITGTVNVSGTMVTITSGTVSTSLAAGSEIIIDGISCTLYASPISTTRFEITENLGTKTSVSLFIPEPLLIGQPLPVMWGPYGEGFLDTVMFACGDSINPGTLYWTNPSDPDSASDKNQLEVCSPSEPLLNGFLFNNTAYVFSDRDLYVIYPDRRADGGLTFKANKTGLGLGLAGRFAFCIGESRLWFVSKDGIYVSEGSTPISITDEDLYPLFPHDGLVGINTNGYIAPDFTSTGSHRLSIGDSILFYDYKGTDGNYYTWLYDITNKIWYFDSYGRQVITRYYEEDDISHRWLMGANNGKLYSYGGTSDDGLPISCQYRGASDDFGDARLNKIIAEDYIDYDPDRANITVQPGFDNYTILPASTILTNTAGRRQQVIDINSGAGTLIKNITHDITWSSITATPKLYLFDYYFLIKVVSTFRRFTDYTDLGYTGPKYIRGLRVRADTENVARNIIIQYDNTATGVTLSVQHNGELIKSYDVPTPFMANLVRIAPQDALLWRLYDVEFIFDKYPDLDDIITEWVDGGYNGAKWLQGIVLRADSNNTPVNVLVKSDDGNTIATLTCQHNGDQVIAYEWNPYITHLMRLVPQGNIRIIDAKWVYNIEPELASIWWTQQTSHGLQGYEHIRRGYITHLSTADISLLINIDGVDQPLITIPHSNGLRKKTHFTLPAIKGKVFYYKLTSANDFRLYKEDCEIRLKQWGSAGEYLKVNPFGDISFDKGATI